MIHVVGLGPGDLARVAGEARLLLTDPALAVFLRTIEHPAAAELAEMRDVVACDDLYDAAGTFDEVYRAIADRVVGASLTGDVVYAVPGSPTVGELAVPLVRTLAERRGVPVTVHAAESFVDAVTTVVGLDPLADGLKILNGHELPDPLIFDVPSVIGHLDTPIVLGDVLARLDRLLGEETDICVLRDLGSAGARVVWGRAEDHDPFLAGPRTSIYVPAVPAGLLGAVDVMRRLRQGCPWDRVQTHRSLVRYLIEESHELADAIAALPDDAEEDWGAYAEVEEELGDVLLQVLFHAVIAAERGAFDIDDVATRLRQKLIRRHPHVFGDVEASDAEAVRSNWDVIKASEKEGTGDGSALAGVPSALGGLERAAQLGRRAAKVGFDWPDVGGVLAKVEEELAEVRAAAGDPAAAGHEIGDLLFAVVNLARHLDVEPEVAIRSASHRFEARFRSMEEDGPLEGLTPEEMDARWNAVKDAERGTRDAGRQNPEA